MATVRVPEQSKNNVDSVYQWNVPKHIYSFLQNILDQAIIIKLISWNEFKLILYDFYEHRLHNNAELTGAINNFYVNIEEYIMLYYLDKYKLRNKAEFKLIEMLASLKYYWDLWPRARTFALLTSFVKPYIQDVNIAKN